MNHPCPALLVAATASGQGKTTVTAALARRHRDAGRRVRVFKCGPDFLDPQILEVASGAPVQNLDLWMCGADDGAGRLHAAAQQADLILVEGVMGLYDGTPSSADIALAFDLPVLAVIDAGAMAQTFGALALGLATYRPGLKLTGVLANGVGSAHHAGLLEASLPDGMAWYGALARESAASLPQRHLGLTQAAEIADLDARLARLAAALPAAADTLPPAVAFTAPHAAPVPRLLDGARIAVARDAAFGFIYPANLDTLAALGAEVRFFSPLAGEPVPEADALWLPGGYPELHAAQLTQRQAFFDSLRAHHAAGRPILAECGGMLVLFDTLTDASGAAQRMAGLLPGHAVMQTRLAALGGQALALPQGDLRGHTFHYSRLDTPLTPALYASTPDGRPGEAVYRAGRLTASYVHAYFPSHPAAVAALLAP
ncbi:cobyrinate a,c-diamide synthase [Immundisolibacter sp.]|uniref:cobyrinate a,c-diamide synthase n=1 Tax=Immundisolibacter sp. TaxID=1934948 RepID=UPI002610BA68|nr:cobyrinate a,c-diamide synthase [Immundisolibacter sp.]MDD3651930.1 cobyrinate a,c-diamide synthase [Immundisolibacter sp.]